MKSHIGTKVLLSYPNLSSTNAVLLKMAGEEEIASWTIIKASYQTKGRGQRSGFWFSSPEKNLLCSILLRPQMLRPDEQFLLNIVLSLAVYDTLYDFLRDEVIRIKWPNDVYVNAYKVAGLLIQNTIQGTSIQQSILGVGMNVNEDDFPTSLPGAKSMYGLTDSEYDIDEILRRLVAHLEGYYHQLEKGLYDRLYELYESKLLGMNEMRNYRNLEGDKIQGIIRGVDKMGRLRLEVEGVIHLYSNKDLVFIFP